MKVNIGDEVVTVPVLYHMGVDIGDRLAKVLDVDSYILVMIHDYPNNPVKLFRNEVKDVAVRFGEQRSDEEYIEGLFANLFGTGP